MVGNDSAGSPAEDRPDLHLVAPLDDPVLADWVSSSDLSRSDSRSTDSESTGSESTGSQSTGRSSTASDTSDSTPPRTASRRNLKRSRSQDSWTRPLSGSVAPSRAAVDEARSLLAATDPVAYYKSLSGLVRSGHHAVLGELSYSPALEFHDPSCVVVPPRPGSVETVELYASAAYPDFERIFRPAFRVPGVAGELDGLFHLVFGENANVAVVTNHGQIIDIALVMGALILAMCEPGREFGVLGESLDVPDVAERIDVMVSRMVTTRQAFNVPAMQVLQCGARTFLSMPQTHSRRRSKLDPGLVKANNLLVRHELDAQLAQGGQILAMAASGSQDLSMAASMVQKVRSQWRARRGIDPGDSNSLHLQPLYDGTMQLMLGCRYVLPIAVSLEPAAPAVVIGSLTRVRDQDDCHRVMEWIADAHQGATTIPTIYHRHEDPFLIQVRDLVRS